MISLLFVQVTPLRGKPWTLRKRRFSLFPAALALSQLASRAVRLAHPTSKQLAASSNRRGVRTGSLQRCCLCWGYCKQLGAGIWPDPAVVCPVSDLAAPQHGTVHEGSDSLVGACLQGQQVSTNAYEATARRAIVRARYPPIMHALRPELTAALLCMRCGSVAATDV